MYKNESRAKNILMFKADLPALGFTTYLVEGQEDDTDTVEEVKVEKKQQSMQMRVFGKEIGPKPEDFSIENEVGDCLLPYCDVIGHLLSRHCDFN